MSDFLLELRCEEIPARMQAGARAELEKLFRQHMAEAGVLRQAQDERDLDVTVWSTPRRLALIAKGLPEQTEAVCEEAKGPPEGAPDAAIDGFCRKAGVSRDQLELSDVKGRMTYFAVTNIPGRAVRAVLAEAIPAIVRAFPWPKSMRWGAASMSTESLRWVRPLSGIVAILGEDLVECEVGGVTSGYVTKGHRFHGARPEHDKTGTGFSETEVPHHPGDITIGGAHDYAEKLRACHVIVNHEEREDIVRRGAHHVAHEAGLVLVEDEGLVIENAGLTEWPVPLLGQFDPDFLAVPPEVIQLTARTNQKYFICRDKQGQLANAFVCTANIVALDGGTAIVDGNRKVLAARLSDARFFWDQDRKTPLAQQAEKLARITFHEKLGSVADKVERVAKLAEWLASEGVVPNCDPALARQAAELCKADLVTEMVGEFPELQGLMGGYYARAEGLQDAVADAIRDHYKPVGQGDDVPTAPVTVAVSLADKLDTLRSFFSIDEKPTGSKDPFALRRAALGIIRIVTENGLRMCVGEGDLLDFFADRLKVQQKEAGVRHDLIDAVFALGGEDDLVRLLARVTALQAFVGTEDGANLLAGYKRAANILKKVDWQPAPDPLAQTGDEDPLENVDDPQMRAVYAVHTANKVLSYEPEPAEKALIDALDLAQPKAAQAIAAEDFAAAMSALASLRAPIDAFFDEVTVNDENAEKRTARLDLLARFRAAVHNVADFGEIQG